jgi:hypothetical protein
VAAGSAVVVRPGCARAAPASLTSTRWGANPGTPKMKFR